MKGRDYQVFACDAAEQLLYQGQHPLTVMPTGSGKSYVIAELVRRTTQAHPATRSLVLSHSQELVESNARTIRRVWREAPVGIYCAGLKKKQAAQVTVASIQSVNLKLLKLLRQVHVCHVDEAHMIPPKADSTYGKLITELRLLCPHVAFCGYTATPYRLGLGSIMDAGVFTAVGADMSGIEPFGWLVQQGYLSMLIPRAAETEYDVSEVKTTAGDFNQKQLEAAVNGETITHRVVEEMITAAHDRNSWLIFAAGVAHVEHVTSVVNELGAPYGIQALALHSRLSPAQRRENIKRHERGEVRVLVNNGILTTGYDNPQIDFIGMTRPTQSPGLHVQMLGRGSRVVYAPGFDLSTVEGRLQAIAEGPKRNCLVLDFAGNVKRHGPINDVRPPRKKRGGGGAGAPYKTCHECQTIVHTSARLCPECGFCFPHSVKVEEQASNLELVTFQKQPEEKPAVEEREFRVRSMQMESRVPQDDPNADPYFCITYTCYEGGRRFMEFMSFDARDWRASAARRLWRARAYENKQNPPESVFDAVNRTADIRPVKRVVVRNRPGQYPKVVAVAYD